MEQLDEIQEYNQALDERGIVLDIDPRKMTNERAAAGRPGELGC
jgi:hypothetical protein